MKGHDLRKDVGTAERERDHVRVRVKTPLHARARGRARVRPFATLTLALALALPGCKRVKQPKTYHVSQSSQAIDTFARLYPGPEPTNRAELRGRALPINNPLEGDKKAIQEGRRLYNWMNCKGCHGEGGGGIGPTLWDDQWKYGGRGADIAESILYGRPEGMPAFAGQIPEENMWRIIAYVQSMEPRGGPYNSGKK
jgi:cytochrome c oxidase cbb3-type subunit III